MGVNNTLYAQLITEILSITGKRLSMEHDCRLSGKLHARTAAMSSECRNVFQVSQSYKLSEHLQVAWC